MFFWNAQVSKQEQKQNERKKKRKKKLQDIQKQQQQQKQQTEKHDAKEQNKFPETDLKEMEFYEILDKGFNITTLKELN